jgi:hypothetical protein
MQLQQVTTGSGPVPPRRIFLGAAVAGGVGASVIAFDTRAVFAQKPEDDAILSHITREAARIARAFQGQPRADDYRALAVNNRLFATYVRSRNLDALIKQEMSRLVRRRGRHDVLRRAMSPAMADHHRHTLSTLGVHMHNEPPLPQNVFESQLDRILQNGGLADQLETTASDLDKMHRRMEKIIASNRGAIVLAQTTEEQLRCAYLTSQCNQWSAIGLMLCVGAYMGLLILLCGAAGASAAGYCGSAYHYNCY